MGRVKDVAAQTAEYGFAYNNGEHTAQDCHVRRQAGGQAQGQQKTGQGGGAVAGGVLLSHHLVAEHFKNDGRNHGAGDDDDGIHAEIIHRSQYGRHQGQHYFPHGLADRKITVHMGRRGKENQRLRFFNRFHNQYPVLSRVIYLICRRGCGRRCCSL